MLALVENENLNLRFVASLNKCGSQLRLSLPKCIVDWLELEVGQELYLEVLAVKRNKTS